MNKEHAIKTIEEALVMLSTKYTRNEHGMPLHIIQVFREMTNLRILNAQEFINSLKN